MKPFSRYYYYQTIVLIDIKIHNNNVITIANTTLNTI